MIAEACRMAFSDRLAYLADTQCAAVPLEGLQSKAYATARSKLIDEARGPVKEPVGNPWPFQLGEGTKASRPLETPRVDLGNTTHLSVIDRERNMVALTASLGRMFGSG
ncbi:MAG: gamma-glutamyltransferase, partial [Anaerolineae bacterium]|nr:gamma-glutamyltransferase [Anaerolineae bacterium]